MIPGATTGQPKFYRSYPFGKRPVRLVGSKRLLCVFGLGGVTHPAEGKRNITCTTGAPFDEFSVSMRPQGIGGKMNLRFCVLVLGLCTVTGFARRVLAQQSATQSPPREDSSNIDKEGTAYITRIVTVPQTISPEARKSLARQAMPTARPQLPESREADEIMAFFRYAPWDQVVIVPLRPI